MNDFLNCFWSARRVSAPFFIMYVCRYTSAATDFGVRNVSRVQERGKEIVSIHMHGVDLSYKIVVFMYMKSMIELKNKLRIQ